MPLSCVRRGVCCVVSCCDEGRGKEEGVRKPGASEALSSRRGSLWLISKNHRSGTYLCPGQASMRL